MAAYLGTLLTAIRSAVGSAWPETKPNGIILTVQAARFSMDGRVQREQLPFAAVDYSPSEGTEWGMANEVDDGTLAIYYVADDATTIETLIGKLETLRDTLYDTAHNRGQVIGYPRVSWGMDLPLNRYYLSTQRPFVCGAVLCRLIDGERP